MSVPPFVRRMGLASEGGVWEIEEHPPNIPKIDLQQFVHQQAIFTWVSAIPTWVNDRLRGVLITSLPPSMKFEKGASILN